MSEYVGLDVSKEETAFCVKDADGTILARGKTATDPQALFEVLKEHCLCPGRIVMETGTLSGWLARELAKLGITVDVIDARQAHAVMRLQHNKTDANDAELLAEIARTGFCRPVTVKSETAQERRVLLKARAHLVGVRRDTENTVRGLLASLGLRFPKGSAKLVMRVREALEDHPELVATIEPLLSAVAALKRESERLDAAVLARAKGDPACRLLMTVRRGARRRAGDGAGLRGHCRRCRAVRQIARCGRLCRADIAALAVGRDGLLGAYLEARRRHAAQPALRGRQQPADGGAPGSSTEGLGAADQEADQPQEGLRGAGAQVGGDPASHADHRRGVPLARKGGRDDLRKPPRGETTVPRKRKRRPRRDGGRGDPAPLVARRTTIRECALYPGRPKPKGTIMKRAGHDAGDDFADNRVPGGDKRFGRA